MQTAITSMSPDPTPFSPGVVVVSGVMVVTVVVSVTRGVDVDVGVAEGVVARHPTQGLPRDPSEIDACMTLGRVGSGSVLQGPKDGQN